MTVRFGPFSLDTEGRQLWRGRRRVHLTPKAFALLWLLVEQRPRAVAKTRILAELWPATFVCESNLASLVKELRHALGDAAHEPRFVRTVHGFGYAFCAEAQLVPPAHLRDGSARAETGRNAVELRLLYERREVALEAGDNLLGRCHEAYLWLDHPSVSCRHAVIHVAGGEAWIEDCGSLSGTYVGGERLRTRFRLADGDEIRVGDVPLVLRRYQG